MDYPAVNINLRNGLGAFISAGRSHKYGKSVEQGVKELSNYIQNQTQICKNTKFVIIAYSQGAQVAGDTIKIMQNLQNISYVALYGDPLLFLPEGNNRDACKGQNLSSYRIDVQDCKVESGMLGARIPYAPENLNGRIGTWCNKGDAICGSGHKLQSDTHLKYSEKIS